MNKLYLAMLCILCGSGGIFADKIDDLMAKIPLTEKSISFKDTTGNSCVAFSYYRVDPVVIRDLLTPSTTGMYTLQAYDRALTKQVLQRVLKNESWFGRHKGMLGLAVGLVLGAAGLELFSKLFPESPEIGE